MTIDTIHSNQSRTVVWSIDFKDLTVEIVGICIFLSVLMYGTALIKKRLSVRCLGGVH